MTIRGPGGAGRLLLVFGALSLAAVATGAAVAAFSGVPAASWIRNLAAWAAGGAAATAIAVSARPGIGPVVLWTLPVGLLATFLGPDLDGVHRWVDLGPLHFNVAMLLLPPALVALADLARERLAPWLAVLASLALLAAQPDASQSTTLAAMAALIAARTVPGPVARTGLIGTVALLATLSWFRPDPLKPVAEVEQIIGLAFALSPAAAALALLLLIAAAVTPIIATRDGPPALRLAGQALAGCLLLWTAMPFLGAFPVPLAGMGMSPILGAWLGVGLLASLMRGRDA
jgi:hypothetical protein